MLDWQCTKYKCIDSWFDGFEWILFWACITIFWTKMIVVAVDVDMYDFIKGWQSEQQFILNECNK